MITEQLEVSPYSHGNPQWTVSPMAHGVHELRFAPGTYLDSDVLAQIADHLRLVHPSKHIRVLVWLNGLAGVCPSIAYELARFRRTTRLALVGESSVDRILAEFLISDLLDSTIAGYFSDARVARQYLRASSAWGN